ncbi:MAG: succinyldiaminopimelate transaminase [Burkholderiales bacterium]|nr:succinyldiaminopimelate transaminase [Burkholderiales bacterium]
MNPLLARLQPYPFDRLRALVAGVAPNAAFARLDLSIGEPQHPTPALVKTALAAALDGLATYPRTAGTRELREAIAAWIARRHAPATVDPETEVLPANGSREALFAFAQAVVDPDGGRARVACPNPFYQIYEGAALLAGAQPVFLNTVAANGFRMDLAALEADTWRAVKLLYVCSPANPSGTVLGLDDWREIFGLSDRYGFVVAADECYSEIYADEERPPLGALAAAAQLGRRGYPRLAVFSSLSKRSNAPGLRSGFVAGDARLLAAFLRYRTYHGSAMSLAVQRASIAAWNDETHVRENRRLYAQKFDAAFAALRPPLAAHRPAGAFYLWLRVPGDDAEFARELYRHYNVLVLPGSFLAREAHGANPGRGYVRAALVAPLADCVEALARMNEFAARI